MNIRANRLYTQHDPGASMNLCAPQAAFYRETLPPYLNRSFFTRFFVGRNLGMAAAAKDPQGAAAAHPVFELHHLE